MNKSGRPAREFVVVSTVLSHPSDAMTAQIRPPANLRVADGKRRRLFRKQAENQGFRDATKVRENSQEGFARSPRGEWDLVGTFGNGLGNRYTRLARLPSFPSFLRVLTSGPRFPLPWFYRCVASRPLSFVFPTALANEILSRKNTRESFEFVVVRPFLLDFPLFIVPSPAAIAIFTSATKRTTSPRGHSLSLVYVIFSLEPSRCFFVWAYGRPGIGLCGYHSIR